ncbi:MAG: L-rhamnose mutarotase [Clostridiales bacterium]|nr:L-rhamnose mutarotase [Clostridiales bacterium]
MKKYLCIIKVKPECREEYIKIHKNPWPEMLEALSEAGFQNETIWYFEDQSIIYYECEDLEESDIKVRATEVCKRWDLEMIPRFLEGPVVAEKIFDLRNQLAGLDPEGNEK